MSTPSLLNIPYLIKAGTLYSQIPETGLGDFAVTRVTSPATNRSTRVNADGFIELVNDNVPRLDYPRGGAINGCAALLVEPSAVNLALQSENFTPATWGLVNMVAYGSGSVLDSTATRDPYGTNVADFIVPNTTLSQHRADQTTVSAAGSYTFSVFLKSGGYDFARIRIGLAGANFNLANGTITATDTGIVSAIQSYGNGWYRCIISKASSAANEIIRVNVADSASAPDFQGNGTSGLYFFGAQYETGTVPTSYIPTTTQAITRGDEVIRKTGITSLIGQSEGTIYFEVEVTDEARTKWICSLDTSNISFIQMVVMPNRTILVSSNNAGSAVISPLTSSALSIGYHKLAFAYNTATNGCIMYIDGVQNPVATRTVVAPGLPVLNNMSVGNFTTVTVQLKAHVRAGAVYPNRLSNSELATLTTP
jgi:hypothetical protein